MGYHSFMCVCDDKVQSALAEIWDLRYIFYVCVMTKFQITSCRADTNENYVPQMNVSCPRHK